ncbi:synaptobrevin domain-containing protein [Pochonia chlamydosporia 170]|uniref:Synaptobrevin domain-containing protein n=1 Tax=Pochonia chlamydosporia 170 TaxID=1380566 RepID=A0A179FQ83_METCM|nr:synaptobrevin domain-containing protein [Pochonia chlamydosporia 170]OAQ67169.1 synaptobrevin domain-containing protein [Pochonia chlamydosporia 170]
MSDSRSYGEGGPYRSDDAPQNGKYSQHPGIAKVQQGLDEAQEVMRKNVVLGTERGGRLDNLEGSTGHLQESSGQFARGANRVRKQMWWKDMKMRMCLIAGIIILLLVIIIPSVVATRH